MQLSTHTYLRIINCAYDYTSCRFIQTISYPNNETALTLTSHCYEFCSLKNEVVRVELNKFRMQPKLTASNRVTSCCHLRIQILIGDERFYFFNIAILLYLRNCFRRTFFADRNQLRIDPIS